MADEHGAKRGRGRLIAVVAIAAMGIGWAVSGNLLYDSLVGLDSTQFPAGEWIQGLVGPSVTKAIGGIVVAVLVLALIGIAGWFIGRRAAPVAEDGRRAFLAGSAVGAGAFAAGLVGALSHTFFGVGKSGGGWLDIQSSINSSEGIVTAHPDWKDEWKGARVESYGRLGRTDWPISDTVLGAGRLRADDWKLVRAALDRGINYIDTAPDYSVEGSELAVGRALADHPRDQVFLATKFCTPIGHLPVGTPVVR